MNTLAWIISACLAGGILSVVAAAAFTLGGRAQHIGTLVSYAIGALLGAVFLDILPEAIRLSPGKEALLGATLLGGILLFFILEKLVLWRHCHHEHCEAHEPDHHHHDHGRSGAMIMVGDTFHNFVDGVIVAAAFLVDTELGIITALAIIAHEVPQEVGDFAILLHSGYSRARAFQLNLLSGVAMLIGGLLGYFALQAAQGYVPTLLALAAASMIYVAVADLIPGLHKRAQLTDTLQQVVLITLGIGTVALVNSMVHF